MGYAISADYTGKWEDDKFTAYAASTGLHTKTIGEVFKNRSMSQLLDPRGLSVRESRDSVTNPVSTPIMIGLDVTGSMGHIAHEMAKHGLNTTLRNIYDRRPITDPHCLIMGIGDIEWDQAPFQISQFEADIRLLEQLQEVYIEGHGGGNHYESYALAWYAATHHTSCDAFEKRGKKGYLFTIGDEEPTARLPSHKLQEVFGSAPQGEVDLEHLLTLTRERWEVFHIIVAQGDYATRYPDRVKARWHELLGDDALWLANYKKLPEVIVSAIQVAEGADAGEVASSWDDPDGSIGAVVQTVKNRKITLD